MTTTEFVLWGYRTGLLPEPYPIKIFDDELDEPPPSDDLHNCPACEYVWRLYGEQACHAHGRCD